MSKEATGSHGQVVGSASYFSQINRSTFWGKCRRLRLRKSAAGAGRPGGQRNQQRL